MGFRFSLFGSTIDSTADGVCVGVGKNREIFSLNITVNLFLWLC